jgi:cAMP-specific phosphodiesterase 4
MENINAASICKFTTMDRLLLLVSCAFHDMDHPGHNNLFEINTRSALALTYNDKSVLENYHLYLFFNLLNHDELNIFDKLERKDVKIIRKQFISNIIATDMSNHMNDLTKLKGLIAGDSFDPAKQENKELIITQIIHFSDISNSTKPFNTYKTWVDKVFEEFFAQVKLLFLYIYLLGR